MATGKRIYAQPGYAVNGRIKPFYAVINGKLEHHPEGVYHLRYMKGEKRVWESVGTDAQAAVTSQLKKESALAARAAGVVVVDDAVNAPSGRDLAAAIAEYIAEVKAAKAKSTYIAYKDRADLRSARYRSVCGQAPGDAHPSGKLTIRHSPTGLQSLSPMVSPPGDLISSQ